MTDDKPVNTLPAALAYAARGISVFPLGPWDDARVPESRRGKMPTVENGLTAATLAAVQIETWWSDRPGCNVGIATGAPAGFWVVDVDGADGEASLAALVAEHGPLPETPEQTTGKGRHICFAYDPARPIKNSQSRHAKHVEQYGPDPRAKIDVRGDGGYIVAAPSRHAKGHTYTWHPERRPSKMAFALAPDWLRAVLEWKPPKPDRAAPVSSPRPAPPIAPGSKLITPYGEKILREESAKIRAAQPGTQENTLNACAFNIGTLVGANEISESIARAEMIDAGMSIARDWTPLDVAQKVERAIQQGMLKPRVKPELQPRGYGAHHALPPPREEPPPIDSPEATQRPSPDGEDGYMTGTEWKRDLIPDEDGKPIARIMNAILFLIHHPDIIGALAYDTFALRVVLLRRPPWEAVDGTEWEPRPITDNDVTWATAWIESHGLAMKPPAIHAASVAAAMRNSFNPAVDWLCEQVWDGKDRLSGWLTYYMGAEGEDEEAQGYISNVGRKWMIGAVARIMRPGCKMDNMLILEGPQYLGKSKAARCLGTFGKQSFFTDELADIGSKDAAMQLQGVAIIELAELDKFGKAAITTIKAWLTRTVDRYRPPYGKHVIAAPRQSVLIGTMNPGGNGYLDDATGGRRFWPVVVTAIDHDALAADQPQLWAEALAAFRAGETWWLDDAEQVTAAKKQQADRYQDDAWAEEIDRYTIGKSQVRTEIIAGDACLKIPIKDQNIKTARRIAEHLTARGWIRVKQYDATAGKAKWIYVRTDLNQQQQGELI